MDTYEKIPTSVLADVTLTDAEYRLIGYLATRPPGWVVIPSVVARELKRNERYWVWPALKLLLARGILTKVRERGEHGQLGPVTFTINRDTIIASAQVASTDCETAGSGSQHAGKQHVDNTLPDNTLSNNSRVRTDREVRTKTSPAELPIGNVVALEPGPLRRTQRARQIPDGFVEALRLDQGFLQFLREDCRDIDIKYEMTRFVNNAHQNGRTCKDWKAAARNWMLKAQREERQRRPAQDAGPPQTATGWRPID